MQLLRLKYLVPVFFIFISNLSCQPEKKPGCIEITFWYGKNQTFGEPGLAQKWINILGSVKAKHGIRELSYRLNENDSVKISWGSDKHRLAGNGDFNIDIHYLDVPEGQNLIKVSVLDSAGHRYVSHMNFYYYKGNSWPLPYEVNWKNVKNIQDAVQVVDGNWELTAEGVRTLDPWYDRVLALGDSSWENYEISTTVTFHDYTPPFKDPPSYGVSHAALASRWPGHDKDEYQPHRKWYPLGATCEFQLKENLDRCRWRILGGRSLRTEDNYQHQSIRMDVKYRMKSQVETIDKGLTRYRVKLWEDGIPEPEFWQLTAMEGAEDIQSGSALLIAHNTDVTFGNIYIKPLE